MSDEQLRKDLDEIFERGRDTLPPGVADMVKDITDELDIPLKMIALAVKVSPFHAMYLLHFCAEGVSATWGGWDHRLPAVADESTTVMARLLGSTASLMGEEFIRDIWPRRNDEDFPDLLSEFIDRKRAELEERLGGKDD